jgi:hypothetical protein
MAMSAQRHPLVPLLAAAATIGCNRSLAHPCSSDVECAVGWSCVYQLCQPTSAIDAGGADRPGDLASTAVDAPADRPASDAVPDIPPARDAVSEAAPDAAPDDAGSEVAPNFMFVTSMTYVPLWRTLDAADRACNDAAAAAQLPGTYRAWLSTSTLDARDRLAGARGWVRVDGAPFADTVDQIVQSRVLNPPNVDEFGQAHPGGDPEMLVATGTATGGLRTPGAMCVDWTMNVVQGVMVGEADATGGLWTAERAGNCGDPARLYCFGVDRAVPLVPARAAGKRAFVTSTPFIPGGGIASADALCASEAVMWGQSGTFKALLATSTASAADRFTSPSSTVWVRLDGIALNAPGASLFDGPLASPLNVNSGSAYLFYNPVFTGAHTPREVGTTASTCDDWRSASPITAALGGRACVTTGWFYDGASDTCGRTDVCIYCLED